MSMKKITLKRLIFGKVKIFLIIVLFCSGGVGYYLLELGPEEQQRVRVQPLLELGFRFEDAVRFDQKFSDQRFRWPWEGNEAYHGDEIKFAEMWLNNSVITEILLNYYYCASSNYHSLVWLLGSIKRGVSFWDEAVRFVVYGDMNHDGVSNYDSLLGPNADVLDPIMPNPATIYALEKNLSKDIIRMLKTFDKDGKMSEWEREIIDLAAAHKISEDCLVWISEGVEPSPATIYAIKQGLPKDWIERVNPLGEDGNLAEWEKYIINNLAVLPSVYVDWAIEKAVEKAAKKRGLTPWEEYIVNNIDNLPSCFIEEIFVDKYVSYEEWMQARFLARFSREHLMERDESWINNSDLDGDGFTNEFEVSIMSSDLYAHNERFAVLAYSEGLPSSWGEQVAYIEDFLKSNGFEKSNIYRLYGENMTLQNFNQIVEDIVARSDEDDIVLILLAGHGVKNEIYFSNGWISYERINDTLLKIKAWQILIIDACYSGSAKTHLMSEKRILITSSREDEETYKGTSSFIFDAMRDKMYDSNNDGYCSIMEAFYGAKAYIESKFGNHPQLINESLAEKIYITEVYLGD